MEVAAERRNTDGRDSSLRPPLTTHGAILTIVKCAIGAGSFSLPRAFMDGGVYLSFFFTLFLGLLSAYTILILLDSSEIASTVIELRIKAATKNSEIALESGKILEYRSTKFNYVPIVEESIDPLLLSENVEACSLLKSCLTYPEVGAIAFPEAELSLRGRKCNVAYLIISCGILLTSLGVCAAYVDFIADTLPDVLRNFMKYDQLFLTRNNTPWIIMPIILALSFLRTLKVLTYTSLIGNIAVFSGCIGVITYGYVFYRQDITLDHNFVEWKTLPRYVGGNTFLFAIHVVILPIMQQMDGSESNRRQKLVVAGSFSFITLFNAIFGVLGFLLFASSECRNVQQRYIGPCDNILSNMSGGSMLDTIRLLVCVDLLFTVPLILAASRVILEKLILESSVARRFQQRWFQHQHISGCSWFKFSLFPCSHHHISENEIKVIPLGNDGRLSGVNAMKANAANCNDSESKNNFVFDTMVIEPHIEMLRTQTSESPCSTSETEQSIFPDNSFFTFFVQYTVRSILVTTVIVMSVSIPQFGDMVDLVGGLVMPLTCFLLPSAMKIRLSYQVDQLTLLPAHTRVVSSGSDSNGVAPLIHKGKGSMSRTALIGHSLIILFGIFTMVATSSITK